MPILCPKLELEELSELCSRLWLSAGKLSGRVHSSIARAELSTLMARIDSYFSCKIEGLSFEFWELDKALNTGSDGDPVTNADLWQGYAHFKAHRSITERLATEPSSNIAAADFVCGLHQQLYRGVPIDCRYVKDDHDQRFLVQPGQLRDCDVRVGRHLAPSPESLPAYLSQLGKSIFTEELRHTEIPITVAAVHHRLAWIHPFLDGNGRVVRLLSMAQLAQLGLNANGLWSLSRAIFRTRRDYYNALAMADDDLSDSSNQAEQKGSGVAKFAIYFLETALSEIDSMLTIFSLPSLRKGVETHFALNVERYSPHAESLMRVVKALINEGEISRSRVRDVVSRKATVSAKVIQTGLDAGLFSSPSARGPLRMAFPEQAIRDYFPGLI